MNEQNKTLRVTKTTAKNLLDFVAELQNDWNFRDIDFANAKIHCVEDDYANNALYIFENDTLKIYAVHIDN